MRHSHILRPNHGHDSPQNAIWLDTETHPRTRHDGVIEHRLWFGWLAHSRQRSAGDWTEPVWHRFTTPAEACQCISSLCRAQTRTYMFAHNVGFDAPVLDLFAQMNTLGWTLKTAVIAGPPVILSWVRDTMTLTCLDTMNWWPIKLSTIGDSIGVPKLPMPGQRAGSAVWDTYCRRDVEVIMRAMMRWWSYLSENDLGGFAPTAAGQALRTYRHRFMRHPILIDDHPRALDLARQSYHGGRVECFRLGRIPGRVHVVDVNSMYPAVMREGLFPARLISTRSRCNVDTLRRDLSEHCVIASVLIETDTPAWPVLHDGRLIFPIGCFRTTLASPELRHALNSGVILRVYREAIYESAPIFTAYVDYFYRSRLRARHDHNEVEQNLHKLLLNSLYGKFGQCGVTRIYEGQTSDLTARSERVYDHDSGCVYTAMQLGGLVQHIVYGGESTHSHPAIAAHVTAGARMHLWALIERAGRENVYYCDTDSLWVNATGMSRLRALLHPSKLGMLKLQETSSRITIHGLKDYVIGGRKVIKGVRANARCRAEGEYEQEQWSGLRGLVRSGDVSAPTTRTVIKHLSRDYAKGIVHDDGTVSPIILDDHD